MPNLGLEIKRKCRFCGKVFLIKTLDSTSLFVFVPINVINLQRMNIQTMFLFCGQFPQISKRGIQYSASILQRNDDIGI